MRDSLTCAAQPVARAIAACRYTLNPDALMAQSGDRLRPATAACSYQKDADEPLPLASLTKLMTAQTVLSHASRHQLRSPSQPTMILIERRRFGLSRSGRRYARSAILLRFGLVASSNDAMAAAAASLGADYLRRDEHSAQQSSGSRIRYFLNPTGLDESATPPAHTARRTMSRGSRPHFYQQYPALL